MTLELDESILSHRSCRDVVASGVYRAGLKRVAADLDLSPGNLSVALSDDPHRKFSVDELEMYVQSTGDTAPILYLVARYIDDVGATRDHALQKVVGMLQELPAMLATAGLQQGAVPKGRRGR